MKTAISPSGPDDQTGSDVASDRRCLSIRKILRCIRPEHIVLSSRPTETSICGTVKYVEDYGNRYGVYIDVKGEKSELIAICNDSVPRPGENIFINIDFRKLHLFDAQSEKSLGYPEEIRRLNAALDFSMPDAQNKNQKAGGKYHESFGQYQCV